jgi:geranylgeranyl reductase family protein
MAGLEFSEGMASGIEHESTEIRDGGSGSAKDLPVKPTTIATAEGAAPRPLKRRKKRAADVLVVGGGPAGSTLAWDLARKGVRVVLLERRRFPREKVCGDYVDPRGIEVLRAMGCLERLERSRPPRITRTATHVDWTRHYEGPIPFYGESDHLVAHGYTIPREQLDAAMLEAAVRAGATVHEETTVTDVRAGAGGVELSAEHDSTSGTYRSRLVVGADGVNSIVAGSQGLAAADPRRTVTARRAYAHLGAEQSEDGAAEIFFDESTFPGYAWMFPASDGRVNLGVGILSEARERFDVQLPALFDEFVGGLRRHHPSCANLELVSRPIGGIVRTFGAAAANRFDGGVLIGDAGRFVDPMTGEGITPGMESALLATPVLAAALESGDFSTSALAPYEQAFHAYFDPSMVFLDFCAVMLRNRHLKRPWLKALARGCQLAQQDEGFARVSGSYFGGIEIRPLEIIGQVWRHSLEALLMAWPRMISGGGDRSGTGAAGTTPAELLDWPLAMSRSWLSDPAWHMSWTSDMQRQWGALMVTAQRGQGDPRAAGLLGDV